MNKSSDKPSVNPAFARLDRFIAEPERSLWTLAVPILIGMSIQTLYTVVDMIFVGRIGAFALMALAFNLPLVFMVMGTTFGLGSGVTALMAQAVGARDTERASAVAGTSLWLGVFLTVGFTAGSFAFGKPLLRLLGVPSELLAPSWLYFSTIASGFVFLVSAVFFRSILAGEGEVKVPVMVQAAGTLTNLILDPILIFGLGWGIAGAAWATVISQFFVAAALGYLLFVRRIGSSAVSPKLGRVDPEVMKKILRIGVPASLSFVVMSLGAASYNRILVEFSPQAVAASQVGMRLDQLVILPMVALAAGLVTLVGMYSGAGRPELIRRIVRYAMARGVVIGVVISGLFLAFAPYIVRIFTRDPEILSLAVRYVRTIALAYPVFPVSMLTGRCLQGLGRGTPELVLSMLRVILIGVPLALFFHFTLGLGVEWTWRAMVIGSWITASVALVWLHYGLNDAEASALPRVDELSAADPAVLG